MLKSFPQNYKCAKKSVVSATKLDALTLDAVSLTKLQQALEMPLVNVWLGLLLSPVHQYNWETNGGFYSDAGEIVLRHKQPLA
jgi:hypothetical protein